MADRNTSIDRKQLKPIQYDDLDATNSAVDNYVPSYDLATGKFTWIPAGGISASDVDDFTIKYENNKLKIADRIEYNIMLLAFYRAVDNSKSIYNLLDGFIDEYEDETGIDTGASTNEDYDSTNDLYRPTSTVGEITEDTKLMLHLNNNVTDSSFGVTGGDSPHTVTNNNVTFSTDPVKWGSHCGYFNGTDAYLSVPDSIDWDTVGSNSDNKTIDFWVKHTDHDSYERYITHYEADTDLWTIRHLDGSGIIFFVVSGGVEIITTGYGGEITDTNWHHIALCKVGSKYAVYKDGTQVNYVDKSDTDTFTGNLEIGWHPVAGQYLDGYMDEIRIQHSNVFNASPLDVAETGYPDTIDVPTSEYSTIGVINNMTLISNSQTAEASPSDARIILFEEDVDSITLNTDLKAYITREDGTGATWEQVTLVDEGNYEGNKRVLAGVVDLDVTGMGAGTDMAYKIETLNTKDLKIHGTGVNWD